MLYKDRTIISKAHPERLDSNWIVVSCQSHRVTPGRPKIDYCEDEVLEVNM